MVLLDTTVLVYAVGARHPLRDPCRLIIEAVRAGNVEATTTIEVVQEFAHVRARRRGRADAVALASGFATLLAPLASVGAEELREGLALFSAHDRLGAFDSVLAATALRRGVDALVSADGAFSAVAGLTHHMPGAPELAELLLGRGDG